MFRLELPDIRKRRENCWGVRETPRGIPSNFHLAQVLLILAGKGNERRRINHECDASNLDDSKRRGDSHGRPVPLANVTLAASLARPMQIARSGGNETV